MVMPNKSLKITEHNAITNETFDRDMTDEENEQYQKDMDIVKQRQAQAKTDAAAKSAILERLGLTADELKVLLG
jgi:hypothetical protein